MTNQFDISVSDQQATFLSNCVSTGNYTNVEEAVQAGIQLLEDQIASDDFDVETDTQNFHAVFDNAPILIAYVTPDLHYTTVNKAYAQFFGRKRSDIQGKHIAEVLGDEGYGKVRSRVAEAFAGNKIRYDVLVPHKDGTQRWLDSQYIPHRDHTGRVQGIYVLVVDIHDRVVAEQAQIKLQDSLRESKRLESIGRLSGGIAHDFNNFLTVILVNSDLLSMQLNNPELNSLVEQVRTSGQLAADLTRQLLAFSRQQILKPQTLDPREAMDAVLSLLSQLLPKNIRLTVYANDVQGKIYVDPGQLEQVVMNLVLNARDAMPDGGEITIDVEDVDLDDEYLSTHVDAKKGPHVLISVTDSGHGIEESSMPHIFDPFFTTRRGTGGVGLGLASVHGIVNQSDGHILVYSEKDSGTAFKVYLPAADLPATQSIPPQNQTRSPSGTETVLVCDDFAPIVKAVKSSLESAGYLVLTSNDPNEAIDLARQLTPTLDLLITDIVMPKMNGRELASAIAEIHPDAGILYMSGYSSNVVVHQGKLDEGITLLQKPFTPRALQQMVREAIDNRSKR